MLTRTRWTEPPRLRHQVARLLASHGHEVTFLERPGLRRHPDARTPEGILLRSQRELVHHQLRVARPLSLLNTAVVRWDLRRLVDDARPDLVVNMNYDCYAIREVLPHTPIVTIINDDFVNRARPWAAREARWAQRRTLERSDAVLTVSFPLLRQCRKDHPAAELFLPWARQAYVAPQAGERKDLLYWGYINDRVDWQVVRGLLDGGHRIHFVGPVERSAQAHDIVRHPLAQFHGVRPLDQIPEVLARCCCSILPYNLRRSNLEVTVSNRTFDLLAQGLPVVHAAYPEWLPAPPGIFHPARSGEEYAEGVRRSREGFQEVQPTIERFLAEHTPERRYQQLTRVLEGGAGAPGSMR